MGQGAAGALRADRGRGRLGRVDPGSRHGPPPESGHRHSGRELGRNPLSRPSGQHRNRAGRERQRFGDGGPDRAAAGLRPARHDRDETEAGAHADLPLVRRRRVRGLRSREVRLQLATPRERPGRRLAGSPCGLGSATARDRRPDAEVACARSRPDGRRPRRNAPRDRAGEAGLAGTARGPRDPVRLRRAGTLPRTRDLGYPPDDRRRRRR